ncbi:E3 ubiquitin- ligase CHIP [Olea europaea subsp. europaea]|uniref:E3 ubiquitin-protein ligase CHIP n=1 Tax=Olea europaea subsp. europaea TaxID=158383 RepID=A0A8S0T950_OLEEU|nr:E3 ubiquitin- ligase CHIP [Olea europaea subsp. europaea]
MVKYIRHDFSSFSCLVEYIQSLIMASWKSNSLPYMTNGKCLTYIIGYSGFGFDLCRFCCSMLALFDGIVSFFFVTSSFVLLNVMFPSGKFWPFAKSFTLWSTVVDLCILRFSYLTVSLQVKCFALWQAHYMLGLALLKREEYAEGARELEKALDLGRGANPKGYMVEEIWQELARARYLLWEQESTRRSWDLQNLKETCEEALKEKHFLDDSQIEGFTDENTQSNLEQLEALSRVFNKAAEDDIPTEVPDYLCCKITLDIFRDPVIAPSGVTYERAVILDHLLKVGKFDPVSREPLYPSQLVPNLAIKEAVHAFLETHGWAYKTD